MHLRIALLALLAYVGIGCTTSRPPGAPCFHELEQAVFKLEKMLTKNIIPFWYPQAIDREHGGYRLNHNAAGEWLGPANKRLVTQARTAWFFARLYNSPYGKKEQDCPRHGFGL